MIPRAQQSHLRFSILAMAFAAFASPHPARAITPVKLAGALEGRVSDDSGNPQMGAIVQIFDRQDKLIERKLTDDAGLFVFAGLVPDVYSIRVTLATFLPAVRNQIHIQAGTSSLLAVSLSGLFSSIRILPFSNHTDGVIDDDWKWVLRSSSSTRPIFRYLPQDPTILVAAPARAAIFTDSRGLVSFSAGDMNGESAGEVGTAFAFATSVRGSNQVEFAGDVGYGTSADSSNAAVRATFSHAFGAESPEISVTMRQLFIPRAENGEGSVAMGSALPPLRSISVNLADRTRISDAMEIEYGAELDTISFLHHLHYFSPYARLSYSLLGSDGADYGTVNITYTSGNARPELGRKTSVDPNLELASEVAALGAVAPLTLRSGRAQVQRGENYEVGYSRKFGSRHFRLSGYRETVQNGSLMLAGADGTAFGGDVIPDLYTNSLLFNAGNYHTMGYTAALTQDLGENVQITVTYGSVGVLAPREDLVNIASADELRSLIRPIQRNAMGARASATIPHAGTHLVASYQLMDSHAATSGHLYSTESDEVEPGLNFTIHQPIPVILGLPFRMEAAVDLRNLLAEGYLPISLANGQELLLVHTPRSLRGGVNFRF